MTSKPIRIGGGSAFFIDSAMAVPQLLGAGVDYIILDYLAEGAMGLLGRMRAADPTSGFPSDFMDVHIGPFLSRISETGTKIIANAGGVNPAGLTAKLRERIAELGLRVTVAYVAGDDLMGQDWPDLPKGLTSVNAYLGAFPIAAALRQRADIVITGRVVDSALALGPLIHEFGWEPTDFAKLAGGTVVGHLIECGAQVTGGTFTDWREVDGWANIGSPIAECFEDGSCIITKPEGTGGLVSFGTVAEQMLYEVGDPQAYFVPDVTVDFSTVTLEEIGRDRVRVAGATGYPPTDMLKVCATYDDGWRGIAYQPIIGPSAAEKASKQAAALFERGSAMLGARGMADWRRSALVLIGGGEEAIAKLIVEHDDAAGAGMFVREQFAAISAMAPGTSVSFGVQVQPCMGLVSFLVPKAEVQATVDGMVFVGKDVGGFDAGMIVRPAVPSARQRGEACVRSVADLAYTRSGEKGETINVAVIARQTDYLPALRATLSPQALQNRFADLGEFEVTIFEVPGIHALNIVLAGALPGGINASQRLDPAAKGIGQRLLGMGVDSSLG
ncbi:MAG: acyclic terpene utilization AtuA family protein [Sphingomonadaceae bacterium]